jgi:hypothetical protein
MTETADLIKLAKEISKLKSELARSKSNQKNLEDELREYELRQKFLDETDRSQVNLHQIKSVNRIGESAAIFCYSCWHVEERVDKNVTNGLNEYNPTIAEKRIKNVFANGIDIYKKLQSFTKMNEVYVWLGGDIITGYIHEELQEGNYMSPGEACLFAEDLIVSGLTAIRKQLRPARMVIITNNGNHDRTTKKKRIATSYKNSHSWLMYEHLRRLFNPPDTFWRIGTGYHNYFRIYNHDYRFHHGDAIKYQGGIGGVTIPANKKINQWNKSKKVDYDVFGHWHQTADMKNFTMVGTVKGYDSFSIEIGADYEPPSQGLIITSKARGKILSLPVFCD